MKKNFLIQHLSLQMLNNTYWDKFVKEANTGKGLEVKQWMKPVFRYFVPAAIMFIYIYGMINFNWK